MTTLPISRTLANKLLDDRSRSSMPLRSVYLLLMALNDMSLPGLCIHKIHGNHSRKKHLTYKKKIIETYNIL